MKLAFEVINWWKWHFYPFSLLQAEMPMPLALLTGCLTRWGSQVAALIRLCQFKQAMKVALIKYKDKILANIKDREPRERAKILLEHAQSDFFWIDVETLIQNLLPLRISLKTLESDTARLDQVMEQYGNLANHFSGLGHMMASLEYRWAKADQKLFLVAYALHPARQLKHINQKLGFAYSTSIVEYVCQYHKRFFGPLEAADRQKLYTDTVRYLAGKGIFSTAPQTSLTPRTTRKNSGIWSSSQHLSLQGLLFMCFRCQSTQLLWRDSSLPLATSRASAETGLCTTGFRRLP